MRAVVQRVSKAAVSVEGEVVGNIGRGMLILLGVSVNDSERQAEKLADKIFNLRFFNDENQKMNLSCADVDAEILVISQFTLYGDCRKGRRPSYTDAAPPELAQKLYQYFIEQIKKENVKVETGIFGAMMDVSLINEGPVTLIVEV